jgi:hypothetical protein
MKVKQVVALVAPVLLMLGVAIALGSGWGTPTLAEWLGSEGYTDSEVNWDGQQTLDVFGAKDTSGESVAVSGTVVYSAASSVPVFYIHRVQFDVEDPASGAWLPVLDVTVPDSRIVNNDSNGRNTFTGSYTIPDTTKGIVYRFSIWNGPQDAEPTEIYRGVRLP